MLKRFGRLAALVLFALLLAFAPDLLTAVSAPYRVKTDPRVLLRVVLCTRDGDAVASLYKALDGFRAENPSVHLRVTRADEEQLAALSEPLPDVYLYPEDAALSAQRLFAPLESPEGAPARYAQAYVPESGETLLCAVGAHARQAAAARALAAYLGGLRAQP